MEEVTSDFILRMNSLLTAFAQSVCADSGKEVPSRVLVLPELTSYAIKLCTDVISLHIPSFVLFTVGPIGSTRAVVSHSVLIQRKLIEDSTTQALSTMDTKRATGNEDSSGTSSARGDAELLAQPEDDEYWAQLEANQLKDVTRIVGRVEIMKPVWEDFGYDMQISLNDEEYEHIVEIYGFPARFKTSDIEKIITRFEHEYNIVWIDDTHLLLVCKDKFVADSVLHFSHPSMKSRPIAFATRNSKLKVLATLPQFLPPKERPQTLPTTARRLISRSLKMGLSPTTVERETEEKRILEAAKVQRHKARSEAQTTMDAKHMEG